MKLPVRKVFASKEKYLEFLTHLPASASDKALVALKGHLLVEQALKDFICKRVAKPERIRMSQTPFPALICFASSLDDGDSMNWVWRAAEKLNTVRNKLSHNLSPGRIEELEQDFISYVRVNDGEMAVAIDEVGGGYDDLALSIFQIYDRISSYPYTSPADIVRLEYEMMLRLHTSIDKLKLLDGAGELRLRHGPKPRKRWGGKPR